NPKIQTRLSRAMRHPALSGLIVQTFPSADGGRLRAIPGAASRQARCIPVVDAASACVLSLCIHAVVPGCRSKAANQRIDITGVRACNAVRALNQE
ncbi:hypothetical protein VDP44_13660, partial [Xanthomonas campestris pv. campestris]|nr:hypothetical protein [Xanthomonas campestris pv. campestris]MEB2058093.1 hypothetical protein [Xanthomonas campestris pv. campestris]